jgi:hypothetical protein
MGFGAMGCAKSASTLTGKWRKCTQGDRLASFGSREEALAFPGYKKRSKRAQSHKAS